MNIKKSLLTAALALGCLSMVAQDAGQVTVYDFQPHWFGQLQIGGQETLGEGSFGKLLAPNAQIAVGRQFNPLFGLRLGLGAWQSKGTMEFWPTQNTEAAAAFKKAYPDGREYWKYNYVAPTLDVLFNLTNAIGGYNPERLVDLNLFAGIGANIAWGNDQANDYNNAIKPVLGGDGLEHIWDGTHTRLVGRFGLGCDFRINEALKLGVELNANFLNDHYNSKKAPNADWYFNGLVGVKYAFGPTYAKRVVNTEPEVIIQEKIVEKIVEVPVEVDNVQEFVAMPQELRRDVFFQLNSYAISIQEMQKVRDIAEYMKANPGSKCSITGYADRNTGTLGINVRLAAQRAEAVAKALEKNYGISADRLIVSSMKNEDYQPFQAPDPYELNRVAICVVEQ